MQILCQTEDISSRFFPCIILISLLTLYPFNSVCQTGHVVRTEDSVFEKGIDANCTIPPGIQELFKTSIMVLNIKVNFFKVVHFTLSINKTIYKNSLLESWRVCLCE